MNKLLITSVITLILISAAAGAGADKVKAKKDSMTGMVLVKSGYYTPLYLQEGEQKVKVESFYMDKYPVTNGEFLEFVKANPKWQRSKVKRLFADERYLNHWAGDAELGENVKAESPVTNVSWFAAKAYSEWTGKRLPSVSEWEYAASAGKNPNKPGNKTELIKQIQEWYSKRQIKNLPAVGTTDRNYWGVYDMFGIIWEWNYDFNTALVTGESRGDSAIEKNMFCGSGSASASDAENYPAFMRYGFRSSLKANYTVANLGFRCVKDVND